MHIKTSRKSFWQSVTALIGMTLIVGTGSAQTVTIDSAPALNLRTVLDGSGLALSSISIDPTTGNAQVNTTSNISSCAAGNPLPGRSVTVSSPNQATQNGTINVTWVANNFVGATTCSVSLGAGSSAPTTVFPVAGLPYPATSSLSVVLGSAQPASYNFSVQCVDASGGQSSSNNSTTNVPSITDVTCTDSDIGKWRGVALAAPGVPRIWETTFNNPGVSSTPFPGNQSSQYTASLSLGGYDSMRFTVPINAPVGARYDLSNFVSTASGEGVLAGSVSPCSGDFREAILANSASRKFCISLGGGGGIAIGVVVDAGSGPYNTETCEIVRGRNYYFNTTFGTASVPQTGTTFNGAYCVSSECVYKLERRLARLPL